MLFLRSAYRCAKHVNYCGSQVLLDAFNIGPMTMVELNNVKYIEHVSDLFVKYFADSKTSYKHEIEVLAKWKAEDPDQYEKARKSLIEVHNYNKANSFVTYQAKVQHDWVVKRQKA